MKCPYCGELIDDNAQQCNHCMSQLPSEQSPTVKEPSYYLFVNDQQVGPVGQSELLSHGLTPSTMVWKEGFTDWLPARDVPELQLILPEDMEEENEETEKDHSRAEMDCQYISLAFYLLSILDFVFGLFHIVDITGLAYSPIIFAAIGYLINRFGGNVVDVEDS